ncbi:MAG: CHAD domain-containing protein, partial [Lapillicoccus sp.]
PVYGKRARKVVKRAKRVQETLGVHQDTVVARERIAGLAAEAKGAGEDCSTYVKLEAVESATAARAEAAYDAVLPGLYRGALTHLSHR